MKHIFLSLSLLLLLGAGCSGSSDAVSTSEDSSVTSSAPTESFAPMSAAFQRNMQAGATLAYAKNFHVSLQEGLTTRPEQIGDVFTFGDMFFAIVLRPSPTVSLPNLSEKDVKTAGVLASVDGGATWDTFFWFELARSRRTETGNKTIYWNVAGMFIKDGKMYIDTVDEQNLLMRYEVSDDAKSKRAGKDSCYIFVASTYYVPNPEDRQSINPELSPSTETCTLGSLPQKYYIN